ARLDRINARESQCSKQNGNTLGWAANASCGYYTPQSCVPIARQACDLRDQMRALRDMCMARLETYRAKERARKLAEEQAERERNQFLKETAKRSVTPGGIDPGLKP